MPHKPAELPLEWERGGDGPTLATQQHTGPGVIVLWGISMFGRVAWLDICDGPGATLWPTLQALVRY